MQPAALDYARAFLNHSCRSKSNPYAVKEAGII